MGIFRHHNEPSGQPVDETEAADTQPADPEPDPLFRICGRVIETHNELLIRVEATRSRTHKEFLYCKYNWDVRNPIADWASPPYPAGDGMQMSIEKAKIPPGLTPEQIVDLVGRAVQAGGKLPWQEIDGALPSDDE